MTTFEPIEGDATFDPDALQPGVAWGGNEHRAKSRVYRRHIRHRSPMQRTIRWGLVILLLGVITQEATSRYYEAKMTAAAQSMSGRSDIDVRCGRIWDLVTDFRGSVNPGFVYWDSSTANLQLPQCMNAAAWADDPLDEDNRIGIMVLTHEVAHLMGHRNEATTECVSMWAVPQTAVALGRSIADGEAVARWYQSSYNPRLPAEYRAPGCLSGPRPASSMLR